MAVDGIRAMWERKGLYIGGPQANFSTIYTTAHTRYKEGSAATPAGTYAPRIDHGPLSSGDPFSNLNNMQVGRKQPALSVSGVPATDMNINDMASLFLQNAHDETAYYEAYDNTHAIETTPGIPQANKFATIITKLDSDASDSSAFTMIGAVPRTWNITIPASTPGDSGGLVTWAADFIGHSTARADSPTMSSTTDDTSARLYTTDCNFDAGGQTGVNMVSTTINMSNNASLIMDANDPATGILLGQLSVTGTTTVLDESQAANKSSTLMFSNLAQTSPTSFAMQWAWDTDGTDDVLIKVYATILKVSQPQDIGGAVAWTFDWQMAQTAETNPLLIRGECLWSDAMFYEAYA